MPRWPLFHSCRQFWLCKRHAEPARTAMFVAVELGRGFRRPARGLPRPALDQSQDAVELAARPLDAPALVTGPQVDRVAPAVGAQACAHGHGPPATPRMGLDCTCRAPGHRAIAPS